VPLQVGIVGLPGTGKTTLFNVLTHAGAEQHEHKEHVGMAPIPDQRLAQLARVLGSRKVTPAAIRVVDVPGTGPALLGNLRQADALLAVGDVDELRVELLVADRDHVEKRLERVRTQAKSGDPKLREEAGRLEALLAHVDAGHPISEFPGPVPDGLEPLTTKPLIRVEGIDLQLELELAELDEDEAAAFREGPPAVDEIVRKLKDALDLIVFFTGSDKETRGWTLRRGETALDAAEAIHSDIARGFIRCEVIRWADLVRCGSHGEAARNGLQRLEGKAYPVEDGDVLNIRFNV
jgi:ribosome-binding ATPase YchF (GTP1/OBG family)